MDNYIVDPAAVVALIVATAALTLTIVWRIDGR